MSDIEKGFKKEVTEGLLLRVADSEEEGHELAEFNAQIHGVEYGDFVRRLYFDHPQNEKMLWFYIRDTSEDIIVSSMALLPLKWEIRGHKFSVAEMGFVGTHEDYRGQGLFGIMNDYYSRAVKQRDYIISALVGIPHYYRKYGYEFALSKRTGFSIPTNNIPTEEIEEVKIRKANSDDLDFIEREYEDYNKHFAVSTVFNAKNMEFRLMNTTVDRVNSITYIVEENREPQAFFTMGSLDDPDRADIVLLSNLTNKQMIKVLQFVKQYNRGEINAFLVTVDKQSSFAKYLKAHGATAVEEWTWQIKIPELLPFFNAIKGVIEERIAGSMFRGITKDVKISDYSKTVTLKFEDGKIQDISIEKGYPDNTVDLRIPEGIHIRLFLSDRTIKEINHIITDTLVMPESRLLIQTIFPKIPSLPFSYYQ